MWAIGEYLHPVDDPVDFPLPRRLGLGALHISSDSLASVDTLFSADSNPMRDSKHHSEVRRMFKMQPSMPAIHFFLA